MNKLEKDFSHTLDALLQNGWLTWWKYEAITFWLAHDTRYTPDFAARLKTGDLFFYETKGEFVREDSIVKLRVAAEIFPFKFWLVTRDGNGWKQTLVGAPVKREPKVKPEDPDVPDSLASVKWKAGDPLPPGMALLNGKLVTERYAREKAGL